MEHSGSDDGGSQDLSLAGVDLQLGLSPVNCAGSEGLDGSEVVGNGVTRSSFGRQRTEGRQLGRGQLYLLGAQDPFDILATAWSGQTSLNLNQQ